MPELVADASDASDASDAGLVPDAGQILSFKIPPVLGGELDVANLEVADFVVSVDIAGQLHDQVKDLPMGSPISDITIDER
jgi:hypothetical protein